MLKPMIVSRFLPLRIREALEENNERKRKRRKNLEKVLILLYSINIYIYICSFPYF